jgi:hypothetical protein
VASTIGGVQDLVVEDREVQGKSQADGVGGGKVGLGNIGGALSYGSTVVRQGITRQVFTL